MLTGMMGPNAKFYGRPMWKPSNSEDNSIICRSCEEKRSACFVVSNLNGSDT